MAAPIAPKSSALAALPSDVLINVLTHSTVAEATALVCADQALRVSVRAWDQAWLGMGHKVVLIDAPAMKAVRVPPFEQLRRRYLRDADKLARGMACLPAQERARVPQRGDAANKYRLFFEHVRSKVLHHYMLDADIIKDLFPLGEMAAIGSHGLESVLHYAARNARNGAIVRHILANHQLMTDADLSSAFRVFLFHWHGKLCTVAQTEIMEAFMALGARLSDEAINRAWEFAIQPLSSPNASASTIDCVKRTVQAVLSIAPRIPADQRSFLAQIGMGRNPETTPLFMGNASVRASMNHDDLAECLQEATSLHTVSNIDYFLPLVIANNEPNETTVKALISVLLHSIETENVVMRTQVRTRLQNIIVANPAFVLFIEQEISRRTSLPIAFMQELAAITGRPLPLLLKNLMDRVSSYCNWGATEDAVRNHDVFRLLPLIEPADIRTLLLHAATLHPFMAKALIHNINDPDFLYDFFTSQLKVPANKEKAELLLKLLLELPD